MRTAKLSAVLISAPDWVKFEAKIQSKYSSEFVTGTGNLTQTNAKCNAAKAATNNKHSGCCHNFTSLSSFTVHLIRETIVLFLLLAAMFLFSSSTQVRNKSGWWCFHFSLQSVAIVVFCWIFHNCSFHPARFQGANIKHCCRIWNQGHYCVKEDSVWLPGRQRKPFCRKRPTTFNQALVIIVTTTNMWLR